MIPIARPDIGEDEIRAVESVLRSGMIAQGSKVLEFETKFANFCGTKYAVATSSGTTAGHLTMLSAKIGPGDEVITTPFTFFASASVIMMAGATPVFADVVENGFTLDPSSVSKLITNKTKAIQPVHLYGELADTDSLLDICEKNNLQLIEDCAQAHGASSGKKIAGSFGLAGWFSFYPTKNMTTSEGGIITTNDESIANKCKIIRSHGMTAQYQHTEFGYNYRMTDIAAAIGLVQLEKLNSATQRRRKIAEKYTACLSEFVQTPDYNDGHVFHQYTILTDKRDALADFMRKNQISTGIYYPKVLYSYPPMQKFVNSCPNAENLINKCLSLPINACITDSEVSKIIDCIKSFFNES